MPINAQGYFNHLRQYLNMAHYGKTCLAGEARYIGPNEIVLSEKVEGTSQRKKVKLSFSGEAFAIKLDQGNDPLFHFLDNVHKPWSKRCDFVIFQCRGSHLYAYCIEFKVASTRIPIDGVMLQLNAAKAWVESLNKIIGAYTNDSHRIKVSKFVFTACANPAPDLDDSGKYLRNYPSIRHYLFDDADGMSLEALENQCVDTVH